MSFLILLEQDLLDMKDEIIHTRRELHQIPEVGFEEYQTSELIISKLKEYGIPHYPNIAGTGVIGYLKGFEGRRTRCSAVILSKELF